MWAVTEAGQQTLTLVAYRGWALEYPVADAARQADIARLVELYDAVWDSMFLLLLIGFLLGNLLYGLVLVRGEGLDRTVGALLLLVAALTSLNISGQLGGPVLPAVLAPWVYPVVQPVTRALLGVWLLRVARDAGAAPSVRAPTRPTRRDT